MADVGIGMGAIAAMPGALKAAFDAIRGIGDLVVQSKVQNAVIDLQTNVVDMQQHVVQLRDENEQLKKELEARDNKEELRKSLSLDNAVLWRKNDPHAYCPACFETKGVVIPLGYYHLPPTKGGGVCPLCKFVYQRVYDAMPMAGHR